MFRKFYIFILAVFFALGSIAAEKSFCDTTETIKISHDSSELLQQGASMRINDEFESCSNPKVVAYSDNVVFCVWDGIYNNKRKIFFREFHNGKFKEPIIIEADPEGDNSQPAIEVDRLGNPHVVWVMTKGDTNYLCYAHRDRNLWIFSQPVHETTENNIESPAISVSANEKNVFLAWQEGKGVNYQIYSAVIESDKFIRYRLSVGSSDHYNIYPQLFAYPAPTVLWYESIDSEFVLVGSQYNEETKEWAPLLLDDCLSLSSNRLPVMMMNETGRIAGVWYDSLRNIDKALFGLQGYKNGAGTTVNLTGKFNESQPTGFMDEDNSVYIAFLNNDEQQVYFTTGKIGKNKIDFSGTIKISETEPGFYAAPGIAVSHGKVFVIWSSNLRDGGDGGIYFTIIGMSNV